MVVASTGRSLVFSQLLVAIGQLFLGGYTSRPINCTFGAGAQRRGNNKTPTGKKAGTPGGSRVTCWKCGKRGHVQFDCPQKATSASTLMAQDASTEEEGRQVLCLPLRTSVVVLACVRSSGVSRGQSVECALHFFCGMCRNPLLEA